MVMDIYVSEFHPFYQVWVDGSVYDTMRMYPGHPPLTWSEQWDIANGYREALDVKHEG